MEIKLIVQNGVTIAVMIHMCIDNKPKILFSTPNN